MLSDLVNAFLPPPVLLQKAASFSSIFYTLSLALEPEEQRGGGWAGKEPVARMQGAA